MNGGYVIRCCRKAKGVTITMLAYQYGVSATTLGRWERQEVEPPFIAVFDICKLLGFETEEVYNFVHDRDIPHTEGRKKRIEGMGQVLAKAG